MAVDIRKRPELSSRQLTGAIKRKEKIREAFRIGANLGNHMLGWSRDRRNRVSQTAVQLPDGTTAFFLTFHGPHYTTVIKATIERGDENRYDTEYQVIRLNVLKQDLWWVYEDIKDLLWYLGEEPTDEYSSVYLHRVIYCWLKRESLFELEIHHWNGNGQDNRLDNISPLTKEKHEEIHRLYYVTNSDNELNNINNNNIHTNPVTPVDTSIQVTELDNPPLQPPVQLSLFQADDLPRKTQSFGSYWTDMASPTYDAPFDRENSPQVVNDATPKVQPVACPHARTKNQPWRVRAAPVAQAPKRNRELAFMRPRPPPDSHTLCGHGRT